MGTAIMVTSGKGGTGKTSLTAGVSSCLAALGKRVLCIDLDIGLAAENCVKLLQRLISDPRAEVPCIVSPYGPIIERGSLLPESVVSES